MKRFISALTAVSMMASMTVSSLPVTALNIADQSVTDVAQATIGTWYMQDYVVDDLDAFAADPYVDDFSIYIKGAGDNFPLYGWSVTVTAEGEGLKQRFDEVNASQTGATKLAQLQPNYDESLFAGAAAGSKEDKVFANGDKVVTFDFMIRDEDIQKAKEAKAAGKEYKIDITMKDLVVGNFAQESFVGGTDIEMIGASIILAQGESEETTTATTATTKTQDPTTAPTTKPTTPTEGEQKVEGNCFYMKDYVVTDLDAFAKDPYIDDFSIYANGANGSLDLYGWSVYVLAEGKGLKSRFDEVNASQTGTTKLAQMQPNYDESLFAGAAAGSKEDKTFANGDKVITFDFVIRDEDIAAAKAAKAEGKEYKIAIDMSDLTVGNYAQETVDVKTKGAYIVLAQGQETTEATEQGTTEPVEATTAPVEDTTAPVTGDYLYGDVNENGTVELVDVVMLNRYLTKYENQALTARAIVNANCLRNGETDEATKASDLNGKDSVEILKFLIGSVKTLPTQAK